MGGNGAQDDHLKRIVDALERAGAKHPCPICEAKSWKIDPDPIVLPIARAEGKLFPAVPAYMIICESCGFVRLHSTTALLDD